MSSSRALGLLLLTLLASMGLVGVTAPAAQAAPLAISSPANGAFLGSGGQTTISGGRTAGDEVQVLLDGGSEPLCIVAAADSETWSCSTTIPDGPHELTAVEILATGGTTTTTSTVGVLSPPTIAVDDAGTATSNGSVRGTAYPGATVTASASNGSSCSFTADGGGNWFCILSGSVPTGDYTVSASQTAPFAPGSASASSPSVTLEVDTESPDAPTLVSPSAGQVIPLTGAQFSGAGESGALVTVFLGVYSVCEATAVDRAWSCVGDAVPAGDYRLAVIQSDAAGNVSEPSGSISVTAAAASTGTPTPTTPGTTAPGTPAPGTTAPGTTAPATTAPGTIAPGTTSPGAASPGAQPSTSPSAPGSGSEGAAPVPSTAPAAPAPGEAAPPADGVSPDGAPSWNGLDVDGWSGLTPMTTALAARGDTGGLPDWLRSLALAVASLALVVVPARLVAGPGARGAATTADGAPAAAVRRPRWQLAGRNRAKVEFDDRPDSPPLNRWIVTVGVIGAAAALVLLSSPVDGRPAYLRLLVAVIASVALVNAVSVAAPALVARALGLRPLGFVPAPRALVLVAVAALGSRFIGLEPAILFGVVVGLGIGADVPARSRGVLAAARVAALGLLGLAAWGLAGLVSPTSEFVGLLLVDLLSSTALVAIGSAAVMLFPLGRPAGASILRWSPVVWLALILTVYTALFALLRPTIAAWREGGVFPVVALAAVAFAAVCVSIWAWRRYVVVEDDEAAADRP